MTIRLRKPHLISWLAIPVLVLIGFLVGRHTFDMQLYDTYYVLANTYVIKAGSIILLAAGAGYWLVSVSGKTPNRALTLLHLLPTIGVLLLFAVPVFKTDSLVAAEWVFLSVVAFFLGQLAYVMNILLTLVRKRTDRERP